MASVMSRLQAQPRGDDAKSFFKLLCNEETALHPAKPRACQCKWGSAAGWQIRLHWAMLKGMPTVFTEPFDALAGAGSSGAGSAAAAKVLLKLSSLCLEKWTAGASCWGYTVLDSAEKLRACRTSRAAAANAALLAPSMLGNRRLLHCSALELSYKLSQLQPCYLTTPMHVTTTPV